MGKKILPSHTEPIYKQQGYSSFIELYATTLKGDFKRFRPRFKLNKITNLAEREKRGLELCKLINIWCVSGNFLEHFNEMQARHLLEKRQLKFKKKRKKEKKLFSQLSIHDGFAEALKYVTHGKSYNTNRNLLNISKLFLEWIEENKLGDLKISELNSSHAQLYLDYLEYEHEVSWRTWNNKKGDLRRTLEHLVTRKMIKKNPFRTSKFPNKHGEGLMHEVLPLEEAKIIIAHCYEHDKYLFYFILIQFFGFARPSEIRKRLKRYHFKLDKGLIEVPGVKLTKTKKTKWLTIPKEFLQYFLEPWFDDIPMHLYIFGEGNRPGVSPAGEHSIYNRYRRMIKVLHDKKIITQPYTKLYDWKRRGITEHLKKLAPTVVRDQAGHTKLESTLVYHHPERLSQEILDSKTGLIF